MTIAATIQFTDTASAGAAVQAVGNFLADVRSITGADNVSVTINLDIGHKAPGAVACEIDELTADLAAARRQLATDREQHQYFYETVDAIETWLERHDSHRFAALCAGQTTLAQAIADHDRDICLNHRLEIDRLTAELRTLRSYAIAPKTDPPAADLPQQQPPAIAAALSAQSAQSADPIPDADDDDLRDWIIGLDAKRHTWRTIPKPVRWRLITATLRSIWKDGRLPSMADFDAAKPEWMPIATSVALSYGDGKWTTLCGKAAQP